MKRAFVVDHMCALNTGHNAYYVALFADLFARLGYRPIPIVSRFLPRDVALSYDPQRVLSYPYQRIIPLNSADRRANWFAWTKWIDSVREKALTAQQIEENRDIHLDRTVADFARLFKRYGPAHDDMLFFPGADYYGSRGILRYLAEVSAAARPRLHFHFIGVLETASANSRHPLGDIRRDLKRLGYGRERVGVSAETPGYANKLARFLDQDVQYLPLPIHAEPLPPPRGEEFSVLSVGHGRIDKGFFRLASIFRQLRDGCRREDVRLVVQTMRSTDPSFRADYLRELASLGSVDLLPDSLPRDRVVDLFHRSHVLLMPYDVQTYESRGSSACLEAVVFGRPVVSTRGTGVADLVERYTSGSLCSTDEEFAEALNAICSSSYREWHERALIGRGRYQHELSAACVSMFGGR